VQYQRRNSKKHNQHHDTDREITIAGINFDGDIYNNVSANTILQQIAVAAGVDIECELSLRTKLLRGYLPIGSCRQAIVQVAFAIGGIIEITYDGAVHIRKIGTQVVSHFGADRCKQGVKVRKSNTSTNEVRLSSWQYILQPHGSQPIVQNGVNVVETTGWDQVANMVWSATPKQSVKVDHSQPYGTFTTGVGGGGNPGFNIDKITANYFVYSTGYGGSAPSVLEPPVFRVPYKAVERIFIKENPDILPRDKSTPKEFKRYTLISDSNVREILDIVFAMEMRTETVIAEVFLEDEKIGDMVTIDTDYGIKTGIITNMNTNINNLRVAKIEVKV
jgi:hypothetical protein